MDNNTLLKIMSLYWQLFIIPNGIEDSLLPLVWPQTLLSRKKKKKKRQNTKNEDTRKIHEMPFDTCFGKSSESEPTWIPVFPSKVGGKPTFATVHNLLPHDSLGFFFFFSSKPWMFYWKYAYIFPYTTIQNSTITFVNNTMNAKPHITHFPPSAQNALETLR